MKAAHHVREEDLVGVAVGASTSRTDDHLTDCRHCQSELEPWQRLARATRESLNSVAPLEGSVWSQVLDRTTGDGTTRVEVDETTWTRRWFTARRHPFGWAAAVAAVAAVAVAITFAEPTAAPPTSLVLARIKSAPSLVAAASKTVHATESVSVRTPQGYTLITDRYQGTFSPRSNSFAYSVTTSNPGQASASATFLSDGSLVYLPCNPEFGLIGKRTCIAYPAARGASSDRLAVTFLRAAQGPVHSLGHRTIGSVETAGYQLSVPPSAFVNSALPAERSLVQQAFSSARNMKVSVWSDTTGLPRELDLDFIQQETQPTEQDVHVSTSERLSYSQVPLHVTVPARSAVVVASSLSAALQLSHSYSAQLQACFHSGCNG